MAIHFDINFWVLLQLFILPVVLPILVGLVTKLTTSGTKKALLLLALSVVTTFLNELLAAYQSGAASFDLGLALITSLVTFTIGVGIHTGLLKPTGVTKKIQTIGEHAEPVEQ